MQGVHAWGTSASTGRISEGSWVVCARGARATRVHGA